MLDDLKSDPQSCDPPTAPLNLLSLQIQYDCNFRIAWWRMIRSSKYICHTESLAFCLNKDVLLRVKHIHAELCFEFLNSGFEVYAR